MSSWISDTLRLIAADLSAYQHGESIVLESFLVSLEHVCRELLMKDCISGLNSGEIEACELIRHSMAVLIKCKVGNWVAVLLQIVYRKKGLVLVVQGFPLVVNKLTMLIEHRFSVPQIAEMFGVSVSTLRRRMTEYALSISATYSSINDEELDALVGEIQVMFPMCGNRRMLGHLLARGVRVQHNRVRESQ